MAKPKGEAKGGGAKAPPLPPSLTPILNSDEVRERIAKLTSAAAVPDPLAVRQMNVVSSGFLSLDYAMGVGGWVEGRLHVIEGASGSGKTALAVASVGAHQRARPRSVHAILDVEGTADAVFFSKLGCNTDPSRFIILRPESAEEACEIAMYLLGYKIEKNTWERDPAVTPISSITYDSWGGSPVNAVGMAPLARVGAQWWPNIVSKAGRVGTTLFGINHLREKPGVSFGDPRYGPGGSTFKYEQSTRLWVTQSNVIKNADKIPISHDLRVDIKKSKVAEPGGVIHLTLNYSSGFDFVMDAYSFFEIQGVSFKEKTASAKEGNILSYTFTTEEGEVEQVRANGKTAFIDAIHGFPEAKKAFIGLARLHAAQNLTDYAAKATD